MLPGCFNRRKSCRQASPHAEPAFQGARPTTSARAAMSLRRLPAHWITEVTTTYGAKVWRAGQPISPTCCGDPGLGRRPNAQLTWGSSSCSRAGKAATACAAQRPR